MFVYFVGGSNARVEIYSQSIRRLTLTNSLTSSRPAILNGSFQIGSNGQLQMDSTSRIALVRVSEHLHINRQKGFTDGVIIGEDVIIQHVGSAPLTRLGVGLLNPSGSIESSGGVRAAKGVPDGGSGNGYDRGFSFASDGDTGIFASTSSPTFLSATIDGTEILRLQSSGLELTRDNIFLGSPSPGLLGFQVTGSLPTRTLHINPTYAYTGGVTIGRIAIDSRRISIFEDGSNSLRVAVGTVGVPGGTIDVLGGIRSTVGIPLSNDANMGYAFIGDGDTGLFSDASGLYLYRDSSVRITIPHTGTDPLILHSNVRMMGDTLTLFSTFEALKSVANVLEVCHSFSLISVYFITFVSFSWSFFYLHCSEICFHSFYFALLSSFSTVRSNSRLETAMLTESVSFDSHLLEVFFFLSFVPLSRSCNQ